MKGPYDQLAEAYSHQPGMSSNKFILTMTWPPPPAKANLTLPRPLTLEDWKEHIIIPQIMADFDKKKKKKKIPLMSLLPYAWPLVMLSVVLGTLIFYGLPHTMKREKDGEEGLPTQEEFFASLKEAVDVPTGDDQMCPVCQDDLKEPLLLPCKHLFCRPCILSWSETSGNDWCPQCHQRFFVQGSSSHELLVHITVVCKALLLLGSAILLGFDLYSLSKWCFVNFAVVQGPLWMRSYVLARREGRTHWWKKMSTGSWREDVMVFGCVLGMLFSVLMELEIMLEVWRGESTARRHGFMDDLVWWAWAIFRWEIPGASGA
jgi:hypothetical protein